MNREEQKAAQEKYVHARVVEGKTQREAALAAGYSAGTTPHVIERAGGPVHNLMVKALAEKGITEDWIAGKYREGIDSATQPGAKDKDLNAYAQLLKQLGYLMGYAKQQPSVAVQINNGARDSGGDDAIPTRELVEQVKALVEALEPQVGRDRSDGVLQADSGAPDSAAHHGVGEPSQDAQAPGGRGQP